MRYRFPLVFAIALVSGVICTMYQISFQRQAGDLTWSLVAARDFLAGHNPYARPLALGGVPYPLPAAMVVLPLIWLPNELAAGVFIGISSGVLAWGILQPAQTPHAPSPSWRLLIFAAFPYWQAIQVVNWTPLMLAVAFIPVLLPLTLVKPHIGLPVALVRLSRNRVAATIAFGLGSMLLMRDWPLQWLSRLGPYAGQPALLLLPFGPLLLLTLFAWRVERARYLFFCSLVPLRPSYDYLLLWLIPQSRLELLIITGLSWISYFGSFFWPQLGPRIWIIIPLYLPLFGIVLRRKVVEQASSLFHSKFEEA